MNRLFIALMVFTVFISVNAKTKKYSVKSPNGKQEIAVEVGKNITYTVISDGKTLISPSEIGMTIDSKDLGVNAKSRRAKSKVINETLTPHVRQKYEKFTNHCNELKIPFKGRYSLILRAYDEGVAFRWSTSFKKDVIVNSEKVNFKFPKDNMTWFPEEEKVYSHQERKYSHEKLSAITPKRFCSTGMLVETGSNSKVYISEADLEDYPGMFLRGGDTQYTLTGKFANYVLKERKHSDRDMVPTKRADYMAKTSGKRNYPWRLMIITENDAQLIESELVYKLASPLKLKDVSWIKPGKVAWDWWNDWNIYGVDYKTGPNTKTYKYYIDFASKYGIEYIILDEGWYHLKDVLKVKEDCDVEEIIRYGKEKNVGVILWVTWKAFEDKLEEALDTFQKWGAMGVKVDFMQRDDQWMVQYYHKIAKKCAEHKLLVDFHGSYKPTGLRRAYPNVITREGIFGGEQNKWCAKDDPEHHLVLPFTRMVAGPMDYTPGAMLNATKRGFSANYSSPMSMGTRCHQLAMYVIYESPLQMLCDNPSNYYREPECMEFLKKVPSVWDDTKVLNGKISDYVTIARRSGDSWYVGAMTDWSKRDIKISLDFLPAGDYKVTIWKDGVNANKHAADYKKVVKNVNNTSTLDIKMASGGGWAAIIEKR